MSKPLKIRKIGTSLGVVLPKELLAEIGVGEGDGVAPHERAVRAQTVDEEGVPRRARRGPNSPTRPPTRSSCRFTRAGKEFLCVVKARPNKGIWVLAPEGKCVCSQLTRVVTPPNLAKMMME